MNAEASDQTKAVLQHHMRAFVAADLEATMVDYDEHSDTELDVSSSSPIRREYPTTLAASMAASLRSTPLLLQREP